MKGRRSEGKEFYSWYLGERQKRWLLERTSTVCVCLLPGLGGHTYLYLQEAADRTQIHLPEELMSQDQSSFLLGSKRPDSSSWRMGTFLQRNIALLQAPRRTQKEQHLALKGSHQGSTQPRSSTVSQNTCNSGYPRISFQQSVWGQGG